MEFTEALKKLETSKEYKDWAKENKDSYLSHAFIMVDPNIKEEWQIGYCDNANEKIITFAIGEGITKNPDAEPFKDETRIRELDPKRVKLTMQDALGKAEDVQKKKYSAHTPFKKIVILQNLDVGQVWNITYVTNTFKTLNIKIDAETGEILKDDLIDFFRIDK